MPDLKYVTEAEIVESFQHVRDGRRIILKKGPTPIATNTFDLTFSTPSLPVSLRIGYLNPRIEPYTQPFTMFQCQKFGNHKSNCKNSPVCADCGPSDNNSEDCKADTCCVNCKALHPFFSDDCGESHPPFSEDCGE
ncbi:hypothetical protein [Solemya velum gill symbiont]|uniref:hypothetical protein n=1 Tax=Solemya velum gill symbiont TaxID=2340 RepID=UPI00117A427F|nr:hypothetical protein [Solemya velum gill symbiont]